MVSGQDLVSYGTFCTLCLLMVMLGSQLSLRTSASRLWSRRPGMSMPIRPEMRGFYPSNWPEISRQVRFERAAGVCQGCGRPHGATVRCLPDGRWFDATRRTWRNGRGRQARWPDLVETAQVRQTRVILAAAHLDHDPSNNRQRNLKSLCQRCHMIHDRPHHLAQRRITYLLRRALGDLFLGPYSVYFALRASGSGIKVQRRLRTSCDSHGRISPTRRLADGRAISTGWYPDDCERVARARQASRPRTPQFSSRPVLGI
jgi:hypothetical protein